MIGSFASVSTSNASSSLPAAPAAAPATAGEAPPAFEVEKKTGLMLAKSPSSCMRCIRTEPTMPRQPTSPTDGVAAVVIQPVYLWIRQAAVGYVTAASALDAKDVSRRAAEGCGLCAGSRPGGSVAAPQTAVMPCSRGPAEFLRCACSLWVPSPPDAEGSGPGAASRPCAP